MPLFGLSNPGAKAERMIRTERDPCRNPGVGIGNRARDYRRRAGRGTVAAVHARMTLTGQPSVGGTTAPRPRSNVMSLVVHQKPAGWCCASAHNTDIVPGSETNIIDDRGRLRSVGYPDKH